MLGTLRNGNKYLLQFISISLLMLLALKTGGLLFSLFPGKHQLVSNVTLDIEESEKDENKEIDKRYGKLVCLITFTDHNITPVERYKKLIRNKYRIFSIEEHQEIIPSPPPDNIVV
ncbi:hypothetical protein [Sphingobacterium sp. LRF_L2]|uniref:hypothetical protein n=1 Tax=Sphingobacterium sp. LRF_L2 TaxID=3369421 RepID=UPI003F639A7B